MHGAERGGGPGDGGHDWVSGGEGGRGVRGRGEGQRRGVRLRGPGDQRDSGTLEFTRIILYSSSGDLCLHEVSVCSPWPQERRDTVHTQAG